LPTANGLAKALSAAFLSLAFFASLQVSASAQDGGRATVSSLTFISGRCESLKNGSKTEYACKPVLTSFKYSNGRESFSYFEAKPKNASGGIVVSFSGIDPDAMRNADGAIVKKIDLVVTGTAAAPLTQLKADGTCTYTDPFAGKATIVCQADTALGRFSGRFQSDGVPPVVTGPANGN
jgi:hypothetical protein